MVLSIYTFIVNCLNSISFWIESNSDFVTAAATIAIAFFTLTLYRATRRLWKVSQEQSRDMKISLAIAQESTDAAKESAIIQRETMLNTQRAFLFLKEYKTETIIADEKNRIPTQFVITPILLNSGHTPAMNVMAIRSFEFFDITIPDEHIFIDTIPPTDKESNNKFYWTRCNREY